MNKKHSADASHICQEKSVINSESVWNILRFIRNKSGRSVHVRMTKSHYFTSFLCSCYWSSSYICFFSLNSIYTAAYPVVVGCRFAYVLIKYFIQRKLKTFWKQLNNISTINIKWFSCRRFNFIIFIYLAKGKYGNPYMCIRIFVYVFYKITFFFLLRILLNCNRFWLHCYCLEGYPTCKRKKNTCNTHNLWNHISISKKINNIYQSLSLSR